MVHLKPWWVVLCRPPGANAYSGIIERSFSMDINPERVLVYWTGKAYSFLGECVVDAKKDAEHLRDSMQPQYPDADLEAWDLADPDCPITIDEDAWIADRRAKPLRKFNARNAIFSMREVV